MNETNLRAWQEHGAVRFLRKAGIRAGHAVLDFGCGEGNYTKPAARIVGQRGTVYALDKNPAALDKLTRAASEGGLTNVQCLETAGRTPLPLGDTSVDVVLLYDVLHLVGTPGQGGKPGNHSTVADRRRVLKEIDRVLKPAGRVSAYCPHLATHTDARSEKDIIEEFTAEGFVLGGGSALSSGIMAIS